MKTSILLAAVALLSLASCTNPRHYVCTIEQVNPEGVVYHTKTTVTFYGTHAEMLAYQAKGSFGVPYGSGPWQLITCR